MKQILRRTVFLLLAAAMLLSFGGCSNKGLIQFEAPKKGQQVAEINVENYGTIKVMLFEEQAPKAVENFVTHAKEGYYDGLTFHRIIDNFMIQGGDPDGDGTGGESIWGEPFEDEFSDQLRNFTGALSMANSGADTNGSQFFIVQAKDVVEEALTALRDARDNNEGEELGVTLTDGKYYTFSQLFPDSVLEHYKEVGGAAHLEYVFGNPYTIFGQVFEGLDVVDAIAAAETNENDKPVEDITIESITFENYHAQ